MTARFNDWEFDQFHATCANEAIYRYHEDRAVEKIDVIEEDELDDGYTLCYLIRMVIFAEGMKDGR
ncbi:MAG: hypothetical protein M3P18_26255, partial [Actinomycetota bacterium]|nr:hypothetical protein [Actinomycetota bacterium]